MTNRQVVMYYIRHHLTASLAYVTTLRPVQMAYT